MDKFLEEHPAILDVLPTIVLKVCVKPESVLMFFATFNVWYDMMDKVQITKWVPDVDRWHVYITISGQDFEQKANDFCKHFEVFLNAAQASKS